MVAIGTAGASVVRVGNAVGRRNATDVRRAGWARRAAHRLHDGLLRRTLPRPRHAAREPLQRRPRRAATGCVADRHMRHHPGVRRDAGGADGGAARRRRCLGAAGPPAHLVVGCHGADRLRAGLRRRHRRGRPDVGASWPARFRPVCCFPAASSPSRGARSSPATDAARSFRAQKWPQSAYSPTTCGRGNPAVPPTIALVDDDQHLPDLGHHGARGGGLRRAAAQATR